MSLINKSDCQSIGVLAKLHGYKGEYVLVSDFNLDNDITNWESVFLEIDGLLVPFFIDSVKITSDTCAFIAFTDINSSEQAKEFLSCWVYQLKTITNVKEEDVDLTLLSGYKVIDKKAGVIGKIEQVLDYNQNFLFQVLHGKRTILIPINEEIIVKVNHQKKEVIIAAPEGLLDLFS